jgi:hypothetical protein
VTGLRHDPVLQQKLLSNPDSLEPGDFAREGIVINSRQNWTWGPDLTTYRFLDVYLSDSKEANHSTDGAMRYVVTAVFDDYGINVHAVTYGNDKGKTRENREKRMDDERYSVIITPINPERGYREFFHDFDVMGTGAAYKWFVWEDETGNLYVKEVSLYPSQKPWRADSGIALPSIFKVTNGYVDLDTKALANLNLNPYTYPPVSSNVTTESPVVADSSITGLGQITVKVDGKNVAFDVPPFIENGRTLVPFRAIGEALGCEVRWDQDQQKVTCISRNGQIAEMIIGEKTIWVNRIEETVDVAPVIVSGRTFVPVRWLSYAVGAETEWSAEKRTVIITSPAPLK